MAIKSQKQLLVGGLFVITGVSFAWQASRAALGSVGDMGPAYLPLALGLTLALIGLALLFKGLSVETVDGGRIGGWPLGAMAAVCLALAAFGVGVGGVPAWGMAPVGLAPAVLILVLVIGVFAPGRSGWRLVVLAIVVAAAAAGVATHVLDAPVPMWPEMLVRGT